MNVTIESNAIIEAARLALYDTDGWDQDDEQKVHAILAAVMPLIEVKALEEAVKVLENLAAWYEQHGDTRAPLAPWIAADKLLTRLRALKEQP